MFGEQLGSVELHMGATKVFAVASADLVEPYPDRAAEGLLHFHVEFSPMAAQSFEAGRPSEAAIELMRLLERTLRKSQAIDVETLCVVAGRRVWSIRCDVTVLDHRGNLCDCTSLAALAALKHLRIPAVSVVGTGDDATVKVLAREQAEPLPLVFHHTPVAITFGLFQADAARADGRSVLVAIDPTDREELVMPGSLVVVLNQYGELCGLHKPGGLPIEVAQAVECARQAADVAPTMLTALESALDVQLAKLADEAAALSRTGRLPPPRPADRGGQLPLSIQTVPVDLAAGAEAKTDLAAAPEGALQESSGTGSGPGCAEGESAPPTKRHKGAGF